MKKSKRMMFVAIVAVAVTTLATAKPAVTVTASLRDGSTVKGDFLTKKITDVKPVVSATASLKDGSSVKGECLTDKVKGTTVFSKGLTLDVAIVKSISFTGTNGEAKVELINSDRFAMKVTNESFALRSMLGDLNVPRASCRTISLSSGSAAVHVGATEGLVFHCTFDGREGTMRPAVGKADVRILNASFEEGKNGKAMRVQRGLPAVELNFPPHTFGNKGRIEFWAKLIDGKTEFSTGGDPRFFTLYSAIDGAQIGLFEYASNSGNGNKGLWGGLMAGFAATHSGFTGMMPYSDIFHGKPYEDWHHYAISWNTRGVGSLTDSQYEFNRVALFIDGKKVSTVHKAGMSEMMEDVLGAPTLMGIPMYERGPSYNNKASFLIDDLKIWNSDKTTFDL